MLARHKEQRQHAEYLTGILAAVTCNFSMGAPKKPTAPSDFMPSMQRDEPVKKERINRKQVASQVSIFLQAQMAARAQGAIK